MCIHYPNPVTNSHEVTSKVFPIVVARYFGGRRGMVARLGVLIGPSDEQVTQRRELLERHESVAKEVEKRQEPGDDLDCRAAVGCERSERRSARPP